MIQVVHQGNHRYKIYDSGEDLGCIDLSRNPFHSRHLYLNLELTRYDPQIAGELFRSFQQELGQPLQVMKKLGMHLEGIQRSQTKDLHGNWADLYFYGLLEDDWRKHENTDKR